MTKIADDCLAIKTRMEEIAAERQANIMGKPLEETEPTEAPKDIDWGMYAPCGFMPTVLTQYKLTDTIESVLPDFRDFIG